MHYRLTRWSLWSFYAVIFLIPFSYYPLFQLGSTGTVNIDIALLYIALVVFAACSLPNVLRNRPLLLSLPVQALLAWNGVLLISILWSENPTRGIITSLFFILLSAVALGVATYYNVLSRQSKTLGGVFAVSLFITGLLMLLQITSAEFDTGDFFLLPTMYDSSAFGVARPTGFALEPQFLASVLLIPVVISAATVFHRKTSSILPTVVFVASGFLLFLTISRGAAVAAATGLLALYIVSKPSIQRVSLLVLGGLIAIVSGLFVQFSVSSLSGGPNAGYSTIQNVTNHYTLGAVSLPDSAADAPRSVNSDAERRLAPDLNDSLDEGYIEESTSSRLSMAELAISLWSRDISTMLFGVGLGGFGASTASAGDDQTTGLVVNNFYLELLVEAGLVGISLFAFFVCIAVYALWRQKNMALFALLVAFLVQWNFFSGTANVTHIWLVFGAAMGVFMAHSKRSMSTRSATI